MTITNYKLLAYLTMMKFWFSRNCSVYHAASLHGFNEFQPTKGRLAKRALHVAENSDDGAIWWWIVSNFLAQLLSI